MESTTKQSNYTAIQRSEDFDLENDSDTTLNLTDFQEKPSKRTRKFPRTSTRLTQQVLVWARWFTVVAIQTVIVYLLIAAKNNDEQCMKIDIETGGDVNGLYVASVSIYSHINQITRLMPTSIASAQLPRAAENEVRPKPDE